jgi:hypothetical protein
MESAPQSTIAHNAVIEFASDLGPPNAYRRGSGGRTKKKAHPAQKGGLKSAGPCQNRFPGATPPKANKVDFGRYLPRNVSFFQES